MILEKQLYHRQFEEKWYSQLRNIIWAEDLFDIDVFVHQGKLASIDGYRPDMIEDFTLIVVNHNMRRIEAVDVIADVAQNRLYIPWDKYKHRRIDLMKSMARYMESNYILGKPGDCIHLIKKEQSDSKHKQPHIVSEAEKRKQSLLDNHAYAYFYEEGATRFHDRSCSLLHDISGDKLSGLTEYPSGIPSCKQCRYIALVRKGCSPHVRHISTVMHILQKANLSYEILREYVLKLGMKFEAPTPDELYVSLKEDKWLIKIGNGKKHALWHNNYRVIDDKTRIMIGGFHDQMFSSSINGILRHITMYDWSAIHVKPLPIENPTVQAVSNTDDKKTVGTVSTMNSAKLSNILVQIKQIWSHITDKLGRLLA